MVDHSLRRAGIVHGMGLSLFALVLLAQVATGAEVRGRLLNGSEPTGFVASHDVRLTARLSTNERLDRTATTDAEGYYTFSDVPGNTADVYVLSTTFEGIEGVSPLLRFDPGDDALEFDLIVHEVTNDSGGLRLLGHHFVLERREHADNVMVTEVVAISNPTSDTIHPAEPLRFPVPPDAIEVTPLEGFEASVIRDGAIELPTQFRPGHLDGAFRYFLPTRSTFRFTGTVILPADQVTVLVSPPDVEVEGAGIEHMGTIDLGGGALCDRYQVPVPAPGGTFEITVRWPGTRSSASWLVVGGVMAFFVGLVLLREREPDERGPRLPPEARRLAGERDRHLTDLVELDERRARGEVDAETHARERERLLTKAGAMQELLDEMAGREA